MSEMPDKPILAAGSPRARRSAILDLGSESLPVDIFSTTDDFATRRVPTAARLKVRSGVVSTFGISTALAFPLTAALLAGAFGGAAVLTAAAIIAFLVSLGIFVVIPRAVEEGINVNLMTRAVTGEGGAAYVSLLYGIAGATYFALEGSVMGEALSSYFPMIPVWLSLLIVFALFIPLGVYGLVFMSKFQAGTTILYFAGIGLLFYGLVAGWSEQTQATFAGAWWTVNPNDVPYNWSSVLGAFSGFAGLLGAIMIMCSTDTARLVTRNRSQQAGVAYAIFCGIFPIFIGSVLGIYLLAATGGTEPNPGVSIVQVLGVFGIAFVWLTQIRVNVVNTYLGTLGFANAFARLLRFTPGRTFWLIPTLALAYGIAVSPLIGEYFATFSTLIGNFLIAWACVITGDLLMVRGRHGVPDVYEFRRAYVPAYIPIGLVPLGTFTVVGFLMGSGLLGTNGAALSAPVTAVGSFVAPWIIAKALRHDPDALTEKYLARSVVSAPREPEVRECPVSQEKAHRSDFVLCPFHGDQWISSYSCLDERNCKTMCQAAMRSTQQEEGPAPR